MPNDDVTEWILRDLMRRFPWTREQAIAELRAWGLDAPDDPPEPCLIAPR